MNRIECAVTAAVESNSVPPVTATPPIATALVAQTHATDTDATVAYGCIYVVGSRQRPVLEYLQTVGGIEGQSAAVLLRSRRAAL